MSQLFLPKLPDFSFTECLWFLNRNYDDCLHIVQDKQVSRAIVAGGKVVVLTVTENEGSLVIDTGESDPDGNDKATILRYVWEWFDLNRDISPFTGN